MSRPLARGALIAAASAGRSLSGTQRSIVLAVGLFGVDGVPVATLAQVVALSTKTIRSDRGGTWYLPGLEERGFLVFDRAADVVRPGPRILEGR